MKRIFALIVLTVLLPVGCSDYTQEEKIWFGVMASSHILDAYTTNRILDDGGYEINPLLGEHPNNESVYIFKAGVISILWGLGEIVPEKRVSIYKFGSMIGFGASAWNAYQFEKND